MELLQCPVCGESLDRDESGRFDCVNRCRARDAEAWVRARWAQLGPEI